MSLTQSLIGKVYVGALGAASTIAAQRLVSFAWKRATGDRPPSLTDPDISTGRAVSWVLASALGVGVTQVLANRFAAQHFNKVMNADVSGKVKKLKY